MPTRRTRATRPTVPSSASSSKLSHKPTRKPAAPSTAQRLAQVRYERLLDDVRSLARTAQTAVDQEKVTAQWNLGRRITRERLSQRAGYHNSILRDLATDSRIAMRTLQYAVRFHTLYPECPKLPLNWLHYRVLVERPTKLDRDRYQQLAITESLSASALARRIAEDDRALKGESTRLERPTEPTYLYSVTVTQIIDGDTFDLLVDLGFHTKRGDRFRLAKIDCPELPTQPGRAARDFVHERLENARTIVVQTLRTDLHGRYIAHLFYSPLSLNTAQCFTQGTHLNAELLEAGHAQRTD